jgi:hypothetical protein
MWFLAIAAGVVIAVAVGLLAGPARRAGHQALGGFAASVPLPALGASVLIALGLAHHDGTWTLAWLVLTYAAWILITSMSGNLAGRVRRAGHPALGRIAESAGFPVSVALLWVVLGLALNNVDWIALAALPLGYVGCAFLRTLLRRRRGNG